MLGASSFLMVSALIIQSLFSRRAFWEFPLMEGQIDSYEIVITAFLSNECTHQIAKEDRVNHSWYGCISHQDISRGGKRERPNQTVSDYPTRLSIICLHYALASSFYLLPVSVVGDWWGLWRSWAPCQSCWALIPLSGLSVQAQFPPCHQWTEADDFLRTLI